MYPFLTTLKKRLDEKEKTLKWLAEELKITTKTINNNPDIAGHSLEFIGNISRLLDFDFLKDYNEWLINNHEEPLTLNEPQAVYKKGLTVEIKVTGSYNAIGLHFADFLKALQKESDKYGFKVE